MCALKCALTSFAIVLSPAVALLVVVTKNSFCVHYVLLVERMLDCVGLHELLELIWVFVLDREFVRCEIRCIFFLLGMCRRERIVVSFGVPDHELFSRADPIPVAT